ncbi:hypothetical protein GCM10009504_24430 [Pseudomonas laurentiana]|nr:hypothetical protein GCM10009504_24430 [Pseudomonas laurentiana]
MLLAAPIILTPATVMRLATVITPTAITIPARDIPVAMLVMTVTGVITTPLVTIVVRLGGGSVVTRLRRVITLLRHHIVASAIRVGRPVVVPIGVTIYGVHVVAVVAMVSIRYARSH